MNNKKAVFATYLLGGGIHKGGTGSEFNVQVKGITTPWGGGWWAVQHWSMPNYYPSLVEL